jgi:hypothetical protein
MQAKNKKWTVEEETLLYSEESSLELSFKMDRTAAAIRARRNKLKIKCLGSRRTISKIKRPEGYCSLGSRKTYTRKPQNWILVEDKYILNIKHHCIIIDSFNIELVRKYHWFIVVKHKVYYAKSKYENKQYSIHRIILNQSDKKQRIDHKNGDGLDNRIDNLRLCNSYHNMWNRKKRNKKTSSQYKGVYKYNDKYAARITCMYKVYYLGTFASEIEAAKAYDKKAKELHGEFASLNFSQD